MHELPVFANVPRKTASRSKFLPGHSMWCKMIGWCGDDRTWHPETVASRQHTNRKEPGPSDSPGGWRRPKRSAFADGYVAFVSCRPGVERCLSLTSEVMVLKKRVAKPYVHCVCLWPATTILDNWDALGTRLLARHRFYQRSNCGLMVVEDGRRIKQIGGETR